MKKKLTKVITLLLMTVLVLGLLTSCQSKNVRYDASDYYLELPYKEDFKILQLTDIHLANKDNQKLQLDFLDLLISESDCDLIAVTGDLFTFADKKTAKRLFKFLDSYGKPWTVTFGNHDEQCYFPSTWLTSYLNNFGSNCYFKDIQDDDVFGIANFAINLTENGKVKEQIIVMDSNRYNYGEYLGYDYIKEDQIEWYERIVEDTKKNNGGETVQSILLMHIPVPEYLDAWEAAQNGDEDAILEYGEKREGVAAPEYNSGFFDKILELGSTKAILVGHDHLNDYRVKYKGIYLCYGVTSTDRIYYTEEVLGSHSVTIHSDNSLSFDHSYHTYEEVK